MARRPAALAAARRSNVLVDSVSVVPRADKLPGVGVTRELTC
jgi:hypothetical protein